MIKRVVFVLFIILLLPACANLQGIPSGLTAADKKDLASEDRKTVFAVADRLSDTYEEARNDNLRFAYWSNIPLIGAAAGAAGAIAYQAHRDVLAGIGIFAGTLVGFNTFTNARANAKVYQGGINALTCVRTKLAGYDNLGADPLGLRASTLALEEGELALVTSQSLLTNPTAVKERSADPNLASAQSANEKLLIQAISDAKQAIAAGRQEMASLSGLLAFTVDSIRQIDATVASKISQIDVNYSTLLSSISGMTTAPKPAPTKAGAPQADVKIMSSGTPVADVVKSMQSAIINLQRSTAALTEATTKFGLSARKQEVEACIKSV